MTFYNKETPQSWAIIKIFDGSSHAAERSPASGGTGKGRSEGGKNSPSNWCNLPICHHQGWYYISKRATGECCCNGRELRVIGQFFWFAAAASPLQTIPPFPHQPNIVLIDSSLTEKLIWPCVCVCERESAGPSKVTVLWEASPVSWDIKQSVTGLVHEANWTSQLCRIQFSLYESRGG